ncbi:MAG: hypothetical protein IJ452_03440 [Butyricicoccus sp.]|nr:hypothetical protein [Butyricicoccus sp.]
MEKHQRFYGKTVTAVYAYGMDEFDFTPDTLGSGVFDVGATGYAVLEFGSERLYISTDGLTTEKPDRPHAKPLPVHPAVTDSFLGATLETVSEDTLRGHLTIRFVGFLDITASFCPHEGMCDRDYYCLDLFYPD